MTPGKWFLFSWHESEAPSGVPDALFSLGSVEAERGHAEVGGMTWFRVCDERATVPVPVACSGLGAPRPPPALGGSTAKDGAEGAWPWAVGVPGWGREL